MNRITDNQIPQLLARFLAQIFELLAKGQFLLAKSQFSC